MRLGWRQRRAGFRGLILFWSGFLLLAASGAITLAVLGPPEHQLAAHAAPEPIIRAARDPPPLDRVRPPGRADPGRADTGPIAAPDPALLEPLATEPGRFMPRIAADGATAAQVYARGFDPADRRPRIGIVLAGIGRDGAAGEDAIRSLPGGITLAIAPDTVRERLLDAARASGHELLIALAQERYRAEAMGDPALLSTARDPRNADGLDWALSRFGGYIGAIAGPDLRRGAAFGPAQPEETALLRSLADRGLVLVDARPGRHGLPLVWSRGVDLVIDEPAVRTEIDARLAELEQRARDKGSALGLAVAVRPVTVDRLAAWSRSLGAKGFALAPVSALMVPPETKDGGR